MVAQKKKEKLQDEINCEYLDVFKSYRTFHLEYIFGIYKEETKPSLT